MQGARVFGIHVCWALIAVGPSAQAPAQDTQTSKLVVATRSVPPFAMADDSGTWRGLSIDLWRAITTELGLEYELRNVSLQAMLEGLESGTFDAAVAALTVTAPREATLDFTHPYLSSGLAIAVPSHPDRGWFGFVRRLFSSALLKVLALLALLLSAVGLLVWLFERRGNREQFGGTLTKGLGAGFWWSAVTMTTVGYGDKAPRTLGGRLVAIVWMFASILIISSITAALASSFTLSQLQSEVQGPEDLPGRSVGTVAGSTSATYLRRRRIAARPFRAPVDALRALRERTVEAIVYDEPILRYLAHHQFRGDVQVLARTFQRQDYAIALPANSPLREPVNRALLRQLADAGWHELVFEYLGE